VHTKWHRAESEIKQLKLTHQTNTFTPINGQKEDTNVEWCKQLFFMVIVIEVMRKGSQSLNILQ